MFQNRPSHHDSELPQEVRELFTRYRDAMPVPDASPQFMPLLWERIEAQQRTDVLLWRFSRAFVGMSAVLCLLLSAALFVPVQQTTPSATTYVEVLADTAADEPFEIASNL